MHVNKFGGASLKDPQSIKHIGQLCLNFANNGVIVISAMGKTTNLLEKIALKYFQNEKFDVLFTEFKKYHLNIIDDLFANPETVKDLLAKTLQTLEVKLGQKPGLNYDFEYDQIVCYGELLSTQIVSAYFNTIGLSNTWCDAREFIKTDHTYRSANIDWDLTTSLTTKAFTDLKNKLYITQGFIGANQNNLSTTLGREGSDYTAAILAQILNAEKVVVWKDVPGILCADPDWLPDTPKIDCLSYHDAIELAYFGAKVIHPKTIKPLQNSGIPLQVRSFIDTKNEGTIISGDNNIEIPPVYIKKDDQILISIKPFDYTFIIEENLSHIFGILAKNQIKVNMMQNSAVSFSISVDNDMFRLPKGIEELRQHYKVKYNEHLHLITIRHNKPGAEIKILNKGVVLVEQRSRSTARFLVQNT